MNDNRHVAALLTMAVNAQRPRATKPPTGKTDLQETFSVYKQFLDMLKAYDQANSEAPMAH